MKEPDWKILCWKFVGRQRRLSRCEDIPNCPHQIIDGEKELIQKAYEEMREACLNDEEYKSAWER